MIAFAKKKIVIDVFTVPFNRFSTNFKIDQCSKLKEQKNVSTDADQFDTSISNNRKYGDANQIYIDFKISFLSSLKSENKWILCRYRSIPFDFKKFTETSFVEKKLARL